MKQASNNEVDLLLKSLAKRCGELSLQSGFAPQDGDKSLSDHLDADELNAYAEGVLPAPARTRYTEHLADCSQCRRIVIGLTQAAGPANRYEAPDQQGGLGFWQRLAAVLSPAVLRYAVPALVLAGVIGIGLLALRQQRQSDFVAENYPLESAPSPAPLAQTPPAAEPSPATNLPDDARTNAESNQDKTRPQNEKAQVAQAPVGANNSGSAIATLDKDAKAGQAGGVVELRPSYAPEPKAPAPPPASVALSEADKSSVAKEQPAKREDTERQRDEYRNQPGDEHGPNRGAAPRASAATVAGRRDDGLMRSRGPSGQDNNKAKANNESESSIVVSGRRFVRAGNTWVDIAYESSRATTSVRRGSEQFRALLADEPGLRTIANQLSGVVYVVWKNRAYRIQ
jgi:hypothetical protein